MKKLKKSLAFSVSLYCRLKLFVKLHKDLLAAAELKKHLISFFNATFFEFL